MSKVRITHASIDENGHAKNGKAGDQTGKEVCTRDWYSKPWDCVIRFTHEEMRDKVARCMERAAANDHIGYDQNQRNTLFLEAKKYGYDPGRVTIDVETDCSALVALACIYAGVKESYMYNAGNSCTTRNLRKRLEATKLVQIFESKDYTTRSDKLIRGDILLSEGHHVATVTTGASTASKVGGVKTNEQIAAEVKKGLWGNMPERKTRLESAGYNYETIRKIVNRGN